MNRKVKPTKGPLDDYKFECVFGSKISALLVILNYPLWGSGGAVLMESVFGYVLSTVKIKNRGLFAMSIINNNTHCPKRTNSQEKIYKIKGQVSHYGNYHMEHVQIIITSAQEADNLFPDRVK